MIIYGVVVETINRSEGCTYTKWMTNLRKHATSAAYIRINASDSLRLLIRNDPWESQGNRKINYFKNKTRRLFWRINLNKYIGILSFTYLFQNDSAIWWLIGVTTTSFSSRCVFTFLQFSSSSSFFFHINEIDDSIMAAAAAAAAAAA